MLSTCLFYQFNLCFRRTFESPGEGTSRLLRGSVNGSQGSDDFNKPQTKTNLNDDTCASNGKSILKAASTGVRWYLNLASYLFFFPFSVQTIALIGRKVETKWSRCCFCVTEFNPVLSALSAAGVV